MNDIDIRTIAVDGKARLNEVTLNGKNFKTPLFMPVATKGSLKSLPFKYLNQTDIVLGNTYHLYLRPGLDVIREFNGIHKFIGWDKVILTDSGGFQGWSIPNKFKKDGIEFKNIYDGSKFFMDPILSMDIQQTLNSDIAMILDNLINIDENYDNQLHAIGVTNDWAQQAREYHSNSQQSLFGIVQGGKYKELRERSAMDMLSLDFDGYAIGGLAIGETPEERKEIVQYTIDMLPSDKLRYVMGLGDINGMLELIELGVDMFDCVWPARLARHGKIINKGKFFNLKNNKHRLDSDPLVEGCDCFTCLNYSKAYLRHLLINESTSSWFYLTLHNFVQTENILNEVRESILNSEFDKYKESILNG
jgi:queuine tRNA-ribosyltransferase